MKNKIKLSIFPVVLVSLLMVGGLTLASEVTGTLSTGLSSSVGNVVEGIVVAPPTANPVAGAYASAQTVTLTAVGASSIHYTTDGSVPTCSTGTVYSSQISVDASMVIEALSCYPNGIFSTVASFLYGINASVPTPTPSNNGGGGGGGGSSYVAPTPSTTPLSQAAQQADANHDGTIDVLDFNTLMINWGSTSTAGDLNGDGKVDILDFNLLMIYWI